MKKNLLQLLILLMMMPFVSQAQITTGTIQGVIKKGDGPAAAALIKAIHLPSGSVYAGRSSSNGNYVINGVRVGGPYKVTASALGGGEVDVEDIYVKLGTPAQVNLNLTKSSQELQKVVVSGVKNSIFNADKTGASTNVTGAQMQVLPTLDRNVSDFTRLTPQSGSSIGNANSFAGRDARYNNFQVNGANLNNGFGLSGGLTPGGSGSPISIDAIEDLQIAISPYDIKNAGFTGANVNAVTRSGTNEFHGSIYGFYRGNGLNGDKVGPLNLDVPSFNNFNYGFRFGGPIIKDKLFFFVNAEREERTFPGINWTSADASISGNRSRVTSAQMNQVSDFVKNQYGYNTGPFEGYANNFEQKYLKFLARVDWNINEEHKLYVSYSQMTGNEDQAVNPTSVPFGTRITNNRNGSNALSFQNSNYNFDHTVRTLTAELNSNLNPIMSNQLIGTYSFINTTRGLPNGSNFFPTIDIMNNSTLDDNLIFLGTDPFTYKNILNNDNFNIINNLTINLNKNIITVGAGFEHQSFGNSFVPAGNLYYRYRSINDFVSGAAPTVFGVTYPLASQNGNTFVQARYAQLSAYVQDQISLSDRFTFTAGVRFELPFWENSFLISNPLVDAISFKGVDGSMKRYKSGELPNQQIIVSPRMSFNWDAMGDKSLQVRGGTGIFSGRIPFVWLSNQSGNIGTLLSNYSTTNSANLASVGFHTSFEDFIKNSPLASRVNTNTASVPTVINMVDKDFQMPLVWRTDIGVDYKLPWWGLVASSELIYTKDIRNIAQFNANLPDAQSAIKIGNSSREFFTSNTINSNGMYVLTNTNKGYSYAATFGLTKPASKGIFGSLHYTYTVSEDISSNPGSRAVSAWQSLPNSSNPNNFVLGMSDFNTPHRIMGSLSYKFNYAKDKAATTLSFFYEGANQSRYSLLYSSDLNRDGSTADLIYIPKEASEIPFVQNGSFTPEQQAAAFDAMLKNDGLEQYRGQVMPRNAGLLPWYHSLDMKILQDFNVKVGKRTNNIQVSLDIFNLLNLINENSGKRKQLIMNNPIEAVVSGNQVTGYRYRTATDARGAYLPTSLFIDNIDYNTLWRMQLGLRYTF